MGAETCLDEAAAIERLAEKLYDKLEHLDPTPDAPDWYDMTDDGRDLYRVVIKSLLCDRAAIMAALGSLTTA